MDHRKEYKLALVMDASSYQDYPYAVNAVKVHEDVYRHVHGHNPAGNDVWEFQIGDNRYRIKGSYPAAKKSACQKAFDKGESVVTLLP